LTGSLGTIGDPVLKRFNVSENKRIVLEVPEIIKNAIRDESKNRHCTMRVYILRAVMEKLMHDTKHKGVK